MDNIFTEKELNDPEVKKCYYHLENYTNCLENKNICQTSHLTGHHQ